MQSITEAFAIERARQMQADAAAERLAREARRTRQREPWRIRLLRHVAVPGHGPATVPGPEAA